MLLRIFDYCFELDEICYFVKEYIMVKYIKKTCYKDMGIQPFKHEECNKCDEGSKYWCEKGEEAYKKEFIIKVILFNDIEKIIFKSYDEKIRDNNFEEIISKYSKLKNTDIIRLI